MSENKLNAAVSLEAAFHSALRKIFTPLARILIKQGITYKEASRLLKETYVYVANEDFKPSNKKENTKSNINQLTGINRKEVANILRTIHGKYNAHWRSDWSEMITLWHHDRRFSDSPEFPHSLHLTGINSFTELVHEIDQTIDIHSFLTKLIEDNLIQTVSGSKLLPVKRYYIAPHLREDYVLRIGETANRLLSTLDHNTDVLAEQKNQAAYFESRVFTTKVIDPAIIKDVKEFIENRGMAFNHILDSKLEENSKKEYSGREIGFGMYYYDVLNAKNN